jgi:hypothetical protein
MVPCGIIPLLYEKNKKNTTQVAHFTPRIRIQIPNSASVLPRTACFPKEETSGGTHWEVEIGIIFRSEAIAADNRHGNARSAALMVAGGAECRNQITFLFRTRFFRLIGLYANAIGAQPHEVLQFMVMLLDRLREVSRITDIKNLMSRPAQFALAPVGNQVNSADIPKSRIQGKNIESVPIAGLALERCFA